MIKETWKDAAKLITIEDAIKAHEAGVAVIVTDGKDITLAIEKEPSTRKVKEALGKLLQ